MSEINKNIKKCPDCYKKFGIFRWRYLCTECKRTICDDCSYDKNNNFLNRQICKKCFREILNKIDDIKTVKSDHVGGHNIVKKFNLVEGTHWERNPEESIKQIKYQTYKLGANAIISLKLEKDTGSEAGGGDGTHYYSIFLATGIPAIIKKKNSSPRNKKHNNTQLVSELEKLVRLKEKGHISAKEFEHAKEKLFK